MEENFIIGSISTEKRNRITGRDCRTLAQRNFKYRIHIFIQGYRSNIERKWET